MKNLIAQHACAFTYIPADKKEVDLELHALLEVVVEQSAPLLALLEVVVELSTPVCCMIRGIILITRGYVCSCNL